MTYTHPIPQHNNPLTGIQIIEKDSPGSPACARLSLTDNSPEPLRRPKPRRFPSRFYRDPRCPRFVELVSAAQRTLLYRLACECRERQAPAPALWKLTSSSGCSARSSPGAPHLVTGSWFIRSGYSVEW